MIYRAKFHAPALGIDEDLIGFVADEPAVNRVNDAIGQLLTASLVAPLAPHGDGSVMHRGLRVLRG